MCPGVQEVEELPDTQVLLQGQAFFHRDGAPIVLLEQQADLSGRLAVELELQERTGDLWRQMLPVWGNHLFEDLRLGDRHVGSHAAIVPAEGRIAKKKSRNLHLVPSFSVLRWPGATIAWPSCREGTYNAFFCFSLPHTPGKEDLHYRR
jgi:hypothetical protein